MQFPVVDISAWEIAHDEPEGTDTKFWCREPQSDNEWVFKLPSQGRPGAHWAEKIAAEVAAALRMPSAKVELAVRGDELGVISLDARPDKTWERQGGVVLLEEAMPGWDSRMADGYTLDRVRDVLDGISVPPSFEGPGSFDAFDVFVGYLMFDCLVANQDRHARNWSVIRSPPSGTALMASYDHGSSLGYRLGDEERARRLSEAGGVDHWCARGRAATFEGKPQLLELSNIARGMAGEAVSLFWTKRVAQLTENQLREIVDRTPLLSEVTSTFTYEVLTTNRRRLLDV